MPGPIIGLLLGHYLKAILEDLNPPAGVDLLRAAAFTQTPSSDASISPDEQAPTNILIRSYYRDSVRARRDELLACLRLNATNPYIGELHVLIEDATPPQELRNAIPEDVQRKLLPFPVSRRVTYRDLFDHANRQGDRRKAIVANSDIWFDSSLQRLRRYDLEGKLLCLSRWDIQPNGRTLFYDCVTSQDAWIFQTPIREFYCDFFLGTPACDNRLAWEAEHAGLIVSNPSLSIRANHLHLCSVRNYSPEHAIEGPHRSIRATHLDNGLSTIGDIAARIRVGLFSRAIGL